MIRLIKTVFVCCLFVTSMLAQECEPDSAFINSPYVVSPLPFIEDSVGTGIPVAACIGEQFDLTFYIRVPPSILFSTVTSATLDSVIGLPAGIDYECSTEDCEFIAGETGCIYLSGIPDTTNEPGDFSLTIFGLATTSLGPLEISFPNEFLAPGEYILTVKPEGSDCSVVSSNRNFDPRVNVQIFPNPVGNLLQLEFSNLKFEESTISIYHISGKQVLQTTRKHRMSDRLTINTHQLTAGQYFLEFKNGPYSNTYKMMKL